MIDFPSGLALVHLILIIGTFMRVLYRPDVTRNARIVWAIIIILVPVFGALGYLVFGERRLMPGFQKKYDDLNSKAAEVSRRLFEPDNEIKQKIPGAYHPVYDSAGVINGFVLTHGNKAELLKDHEQVVDSLIKDIDDAKSSVNVLSYIWIEDDTGCRLGEALARAARRGVDCKVMVDSYGSRKLFKTHTWKIMEDAGVKARGAISYWKLFWVMILSRLDLRNHRKIYVIDGKITYCTSGNASDPEFRPKAKFAPWVDITLRVTGPVVNQVQLIFAKDWLLSNEGEMDDFEFHAEDEQGDLPAIAWGTGPLDRTGTATELILTMLANARRQIRITTPYFVPPDSLIDGIKGAAARGVDVSLIVPTRNDSFFVRHASKSFYAPLLNAGVKIYQYPEGMLHSKIITVDEQVTSLGSTNFDMRSLDLNYENNIMYYGREFTEQINRRQDEYLARSKQVDEDPLDSLNFFKHIFDNVIACIGPIL